MKPKEEESKPSPVDEIAAALETAAKARKAAAELENTVEAERIKRQAAHAERAIAKQISKGKPRQLGDLGRTSKYDHDIYYYLKGMFKKDPQRPTLKAVLKSGY